LKSRVAYFGQYPKRDPSLATGRSLGRSGKVSRFAAGLCVAIHTLRKTLLAHEPFRNRAARREARRSDVDERHDNSTLDEDWDLSRADLAKPLAGGFRVLTLALALRLRLDAVGSGGP
jgi:hypothetical protein